MSTPSTVYTSDGLHSYTKVTPAKSEVEERVETNNPAPRNQNMRTESLNRTPLLHARNVETINQQRANRRPRDLEGYDTVDHDDLQSEVGDTPDVLDLKRNLRKSLQY